MLYLKIPPYGGCNEKAGVLILEYFADWELPILGWYFKIEEYQMLLIVIFEYY